MARQVALYFGSLCTLCAPARRACIDIPPIEKWACRRQPRVCASARAGRRRKDATSGSPELRLVRTTGADARCRGSAPVRLRIPRLPGHSGSFGIPLSQSDVHSRAFGVRLYQPAIGSPRLVRRALMFPIVCRMAQFGVPFGARIGEARWWWARSRKTRKANCRARGGWPGRRTTPAQSSGRSYCLR